MNAMRTTARTEGLRRGMGFTLVEVMAAIGILSLLVGAVTTGLFQTLHIEAKWEDDAMAARETRSAVSWYGATTLTGRICGPV